MPKAKFSNIELYYEEYGHGRPLLMILGLGQDVATWGYQIPVLSNHCRLIIFDNRDSGRSSRCSEPYTIETMARDVIGLMDYLEIDRANLLGTSMGGMIAQQVALLTPEKVASLILASTGSNGKE